MQENETDSNEIDLTYYIEVILRRRWIIASVLLVVFLSSVLYTFSTRPVYQSGTLLVIEKERSSPTVFANGAMIEASNEDYYQTQYKLLKTDSLLGKVVSDLGLEKHPDFSGRHSLDKLRGAVAIAPVLRSRLVWVRVTSHDPSMAAAIANKLAENFVEQNLSNQLFISKEVLQALQLKPGSPEARRTHDSLPSVVNNPLIQNLKAENAKLQSQYADLSKRYTEKHPILTSLKSNMAALQAQIQGETDKIVQSLKAELSGQLKGNNVRIVDPAKVPERPFKPIVGKNLLLGFLLGCLLAFFTALLVETLDQSMRTQDDVERKLGQPFLGTIPHAQQKAGERVFQTLQVKESSLTSESIRNLRTMVDFAGVSQRARQILVTSTIQSEGKTYIAGNLAVAFSQLGENVLLIDGDMRRPKIHRDFRVANAKGLSDFLLSGKDMEEAESLFQEIPGLPRLKLLVCGTRPPNPSELLNTPKVGALIAWAKSRFDRIVVDCTPMFPIHDTLLWGRHIPSVIFVVRYGKTRTQLIRKALQRLQSGAMKPLGVVINAARAGSLAYAAYGYYYQQYYHSYETEAPKASSGK